MSRLKYVPPDYVAIEHATQEQGDACNAKMIKSRMQFKNQEAKMRWFNQCLKHQQGVSSLAGSEAKKEYEEEKRQQAEALAEASKPAMAGFGDNKTMIMIGVIGVLVFLVGKKKKWF